MKKYLNIFTWLVLYACTFVAASGAVWFAGDLNANGWIMPIIAPPSWLFPPVWTILYIFIATSAYRTVIAQPHHLKGITYALWALQLCLNTLWTPVFFGAYDLLPAGMLNLTLQKKTDNFIYTINAVNILDTNLFQWDSDIPGIKLVSST